MSRTTRFSLRSKIILSSAILLLLAVGFYLLLATSIFKQEKVALLHEINHSLAINTAAQVRSILSQIQEQVRLFSLIELASLPEITDASKKGDPSLILALEFFRMENGNSVPIRSKGRPLVYRPQNLETYLKVAQNYGLTFWRDSVTSERRFFGALPMVIQRKTERENFVIVLEINAEPLLKSLQLQNAYEGYLVSRTGDVLFHLRGSDLLSTGKVSDHPLLKECSKHDLGQSGVRSFHHSDQQWYGAYAQVGLSKLCYFSQANRKEVSRAINQLLQRSLFYGLIVLTFTFLVSLRFSHYLTRSLKHLMEYTRQIGGGDLQAKIAITSTDEVGELGSALNAMAQELHTSRTAIEVYNKTLEKRVEDRTNELRKKNDEIQEAKDILMKTSRLAAIGEVAGRTAHEVLNPLAAIGLRADKSHSLLEKDNEWSAHLATILSAWKDDSKEKGIDAFFEQLKTRSLIHPEMTLLEEDLDNLTKCLGLWEKQRGKLGEDFEFIHQRIDRITMIIDQMRELSRASSDKTQIHCYHAIKEAILTMVDVAQRMGCRLQGEFFAKEDCCIANHNELVQIITNLMRNSLQAIGSHPSVETQHKGTLIIKTSQENSHLCIDIIDNGSGIPTEVRNKLFEQGFTTKPPSEGTGLGLSICRRFARSFGGEVSLLYSELGKTTCFRITVPLLKESALAA